jgi:hypothetical protein
MNEQQSENQRQATEKFSAIYRWVDHQLKSCKGARDAAKDPVKKAMLGGKCKAYVDILCIMHDRYPHNLEPGLWKGKQ